MQVGSITSCCIETTSICIKTTCIKPTLYRNDRTPSGISKILSSNLPSKFPTICLTQSSVRSGTVARLLEEKEKNKLIKYNRMKIFFLQSFMTIKNKSALGRIFIVELQNEY